MVNEESFLSISTALKQNDVKLIAVSKTKPVADLQQLYDFGQKAFGENYVQELTEKQLQLPSDIQWHFIGHLQSNKVKFIAPFVHTIHAVDSLKLLVEIDKQAAKFNREIFCLLQIHIADEETKFGMSENELMGLLQSLQTTNLKHAVIAGLMGMATNTDDELKIKNEFQQLKNIFEKTKQQFFSADENFKEISMGMSSDYKIALQCGSTMVRIGSLLFGSRK